MKAPEGYELDDTPHEVVFELAGEKDGQILVELNVTNAKTPGGDTFCSSDR